VSCPHHAPAALPSGKNDDTHWIGGWVGPGAGLDIWRREKSFAPAGMMMVMILIRITTTTITIFVINAKGEAQWYVVSIAIIFVLS
jgi:hypothetical protein